MSRLWQRIRNGTRTEKTHGKKDALRAKSTEPRK